MALEKGSLNGPIALMALNSEAWKDKEGLSAGIEAAPGGRSSHPVPCSCLGNPTERGAWQATVPGVAESSAQPSS